MLMPLWILCSLDWVVMLWFFYWLASSYVGLLVCSLYAIGTYPSAIMIWPYIILLRFLANRVIWTFDACWDGSLNAGLFWLCFNMVLAQLVSSDSAIWVASSQLAWYDSTICLWFCLLQHVYTMCISSCLVLMMLIQVRNICNVMSYYWLWWW